MSSTRKIGSFIVALLVVGTMAGTAMGGGGDQCNGATRVTTKTSVPHR
jgi:hypothetical protein